LPIPSICGGEIVPEARVDPHTSLKKLIESKENKEHECREFLQFAKEALVRDTVVEFVYVETERRGTAGDSDYIISGKVVDETGIESIKVYIWELKAPQCYMFEKDTENRLRPTKDLIQAENQLLHYYHENKGNERFRNDFGVTHSDKVCFGGIIIGTHNRRAKGKYGETKKNKLVETALMIRRKYIYDPLNIRIMHWDYILDLLKPRTQVPLQPLEEAEIGTRVLDPENVQISSSP
jgi:hypothetical protein